MSNSVLSNSVSKCVLGLCLCVAMACGGEKPKTVVAPPKVEQPKGHIVNLTRRATVGQVFELEATGISHQTSLMSVAGIEREKGESTKKVSLKGLLTVLAVDDAGRPQVLKLSVSSFDGTRDGLKDDSVMQGDVFRVTYAPAKGSVLRVSPESERQDSKEFAEEMIGTLFSTGQSAVTDDAIFGSKSRQDVGASWEIDQAKAFEKLNERAIEAAQENISGQASLVKEVEVDGLPHLVVVASLVASPIRTRGVPAEVSFDESSIKLEKRYVLPGDTSKPIREETSKLTVRLIVSAKTDEGLLHSSTSVDDERHIELIPR